MVCLGNEQRSFCRFWDCIQVLHFRLFCWLWWLLHFFWGIPAHSSRYNGHLKSPSPVHFSSLIPRMSTFTLAISFHHFQFALIHGPTFQVPMQYCSLQYRTLLLSPVPSTTGCCFCFGSASSFFPELFLYSSLVAYWTPTDLASSSFSVISFCLFILFIGSQGKNTEVVCHSLFQWTTFCQNSPLWPVHLDPTQHGS